MKELITRIINSGVSADKYVALYCIYHKIPYEFSKDGLDGYLDAKGKLTPKGLDIIQDPLLDFDFHKMKQIEDKEFTLNTIRIQQIFPPIHLKFGVHARGHLVVARARLKQFLELYSYGWEDIYEATKNYVDRLKESGYAYMRSCPNFILNKDGESLLALECDIIKHTKTEDRTI